MGGSRSISATEASACQKPNGIGTRCGFLPRCSAITSSSDLQGSRRHPVAGSAERFGDWKIVYQRFNRWAKSGAFERVFKLLASDHDNEYMMIDAIIVRAHQHSAGAQKKTARRPSADPAAD